MDDVRVELRSQPLGLNGNRRMRTWPRIQKVTRFGRRTETPARYVEVRRDAELPLIVFYDRPD